MQAQRQGAIGVLRPRGVLNGASLEAADACLTQLKLTGRMMLVLDLAETIVIDSAALEWLLDLDERFGGLGGGVHLANANELCTEILTLTGVKDRMGFYRDLTTAMGGFTK